MANNIGITLERHWQEILALKRRIMSAGGGGGGGGSGITQLTGDVTAGPGTGSQAATIPNDTVTFAKFQNISAASRLVGRGSASGSGDAEEISLGSNLSMSGTTLNAVGGGGGGVISASQFYFDDGTNKFLLALGPVTPPVDSDFAWINQGGASVDTSNGGIYLLAPGGGGDNWRIRKKAAPSTPYTVTIAVMLQPMIENNDQFMFGWRQSSDGKLAAISLQYITAALNLSSLKYSGPGPGSFSAYYSPGPFNVAGTGPLWWFQASDNGTNRILRYSADGKYWRQLHSVGRTDYLTGNEVFFGVNLNTGSNDYAVTLLSWVET